MQVKFIPLDFDSFDIGEKSFIRMWGRTDKGERCCVIDTCDSFFWLIPKEHVNIEKYAEKVEKVKTFHVGRPARVIKVEIKEKNLLGNKIKALKVYVENPKDVMTIKDIVKNFPETAEKKEHDINFITRYLIEKEIKPLTWYEIKGKQSQLDSRFDVDIIIEAEEIGLSKDQEEFRPRILAFDIEASEFELGKGQILMISVADDKIKKVFTWKHFKNPPAEVEFVKNEAELINRFKEVIKDYKPDLLVGYFSDAFDLPYLRMRADLHKIKLDLGLDKSNISFIRGRIPSSKITGLVHLDLYKFVNNIIAYVLKSETISLNDVAKELVGEEKLKIDLNKITKELRETKGNLEEAELRKFCLYNMQDSVLTSKLFGQLWLNISAIAKIVNEPLFNASRASYSQLVEHYIIHHLKEFNEIIESRPISEEIGGRREGRYSGAFVFQPKAGLYENLAVFDFRSLYPSIIVSFNISPPTIQKEKTNAYETPEVELEGKKRVYYFSKKKGFIPELLERVLDERKKLKDELKRKPSAELEARSYALKTLANATYGYFAFFGARYYSIEAAASITAFGRYYIQKVMNEAEKYGFNVIYGDTDSLVLELKDIKEKEALKWMEKINEELPGTMELELENFYKKGIFVTKRTGETGAKKKYALLARDNSLKIRGFETVRRDWCNLSRELQDNVLRMILDEGKHEKALAYVKKIIQDLKNKKIPIEKLVIRTQLKKSIEEYKAIGPHVVVAKRMKELGLPVKAGSMIEFVIAQGKAKKSLIRERAKLPEEVKEGEYDLDYYIEHQIIPAVENIFIVFNVSKEQLIEGKKQKRLEEF